MIMKNFELVNSIMLKAKQHTQLNVLNELT